MKRPDCLDGAAGFVVAAVMAMALVLAAPARADYEAGRKAWDAGDPAAALAEWRAAADAGDRRAMLALGRLRLQGLGAPQDYVEVHKWFNLAASRGAMEAVEERDALAARMTPAQVAAAQERAAAWRPGGASPEAETAAAAAPPASDAGPSPPRAIREAQELLAVLALLGGKKLVGMARAEAAEDRREAGSRWADGETFRECDVCPEMVVVPAGSFMMGSPSSEKGRNSQEGPVHPVTFAEPFAVGKYEVTRGEFARFVSATGHDTGSSCWTRESGNWESRSDRSWRSSGFSQTDRDPVVCVSWGDARTYVRWLSRKTGEEYRLLSEAEWEYAARARTTTRYSWGDDVGRNRANCKDCGAVGTIRRRRRQGASRRTVSACTTCTGTCGSGWRIAGTGATRARRRTVARGCRGTAVGAFCAVGPGTTIRGSSARRTAAGTSPETGASASASVWPGRSPLESLPLWGGPGGCAPRPIFRSRFGLVSGAEDSPPDGSRACAVVFRHRFHARRAWRRFRDSAEAARI